MNAPPVSLETLGTIAKAAPPRTGTKLAIPATTALLGAAGMLAWRLAPLVVARRRSSKRGLWLAAGVGVAAVLVARWQLQRLFTRSPAHEVEARVGPLEIRRYPELRMAETTVDKPWNDALNEGFHRLFGFIFGANHTGERLAMTAPVLSTGDGDGFRVSFVLPDGAASPIPNDSRVAVTRVAPRRVAVLRFNGGHGAGALEAKKRELTSALAASGLKPRGEALFAGYDPPSTLPLLRRNELWVELEDEAS